MTKSRLGMACIDSRTSKDYRLDRTKSTNHKSIQCQRTPARALNNKHPYKMCNTRKPHLTGIQEFGTAAHFKDLTLGKLDARVTKGCFMGYESKSAIVHGDSLARHSLRGRETKPSRPPRKMSTSKNLWQNLKKTNLNRI
jgi:hypothetical protein